MTHLDVDKKCFDGAQKRRFGWKKRGVKLG